MVSIIHQVEERPQSQANPSSSSGFIQSFFALRKPVCIFCEEFPNTNLPHLLYVYKYIFQKVAI